MVVDGDGGTNGGVGVGGGAVVVAQCEVAIARQACAVDGVIGGSADESDIRAEGDGAGLSAVDDGPTPFVVFANSAGIVGEGVAIFILTCDSSAGVAAVLDIAVIQACDGTDAAGTFEGSSEIEAVTDGVVLV